MDDFVINLGWQALGKELEELGFSITLPKRIDYPKICATFVVSQEIAEELVKNYVLHCLAQISLKKVESPGSVNPQLERGTTVPIYNDPLLDKHVVDLELSVRSRKALHILSISKIGQLVEISEHTLLSVNGFGLTSLNEVKQALDRLGLKLKED